MIEEEEWRCREKERRRREIRNGYGDVEREAIECEEEKQEAIKESDGESDEGVMVDGVVDEIENGGRESGAHSLQTGESEVKGKGIGGGDDSGVFEVGLFVSANQGGGGR